MRDGIDSKYGEAYGFFNQKGEQAFQLCCDSISSFQEGLAYFSIDGKYGYIDKHGKEVIPPVYDLITDYEVYQSSHCYIPFQWREKKRSIIMTGEPESRDLSAMLLKMRLRQESADFMS